MGTFALRWTGNRWAAVRSAEKPWRPTHPVYLDVDCALREEPFLLDPSAAVPLTIQPATVRSAPRYHRAGCQSTGPSSHS